MTHNDSPSHDAHDGAGSPASVPASDKRDCGCGCGGSGGCSEGKGASQAGKIRQGRRKFLIGGIGATAFAASLASRPAHAALACNLTGLYSPNGSQSQTGVCTVHGKTPGFWMNHLPNWPTTISPDDYFSTWFGTVSFTGSGETLRTALCPPNGDNLAFQIAAGLLNAESPYTNGSFGYGRAQAFANAVISAFRAYSFEAPDYSDVQKTISNMNSDGSTSDSWAKHGSICK